MDLENAMKQDYSKQPQSPLYLAGQVIMSTQRKSENLLEKLDDISNSRQVKGEHFKNSLREVLYIANKDNEVLYNLIKVQDEMLKNSARQQAILLEMMRNCENCSTLMKLI